MSAFGVDRTRVLRAAVRGFDDAGGYPIALRHAVAPVSAVAATCKVMPVLLHALGVSVTLVRTSCVGGQRVETIRISFGVVLSLLPPGAYPTFVKYLISEKSKFNVKRDVHTLFVTSDTKKTYSLITRFNLRM